jgi:DNA-binding MarR family transcriptional regulator
MQTNIVRKGASMSIEQLKLKNQLCHRLYMASNSIVRAYREPLAELNLTYPQYVVMMALWEQDQITIAELLERTSIDGSAMTQILKKMADKGLLNIAKDEKDKRKRFIKLTPLGHNFESKALDVREQVSCRFINVDSNKAHELMDLLDLVIQDLSEVS